MTLKSTVEKHSQILKIHKHFGHATITNIKKLLKNAKLLSDEICKIIGDVVTSVIHVQGLVFPSHLNFKMLYLQIFIISSRVCFT